MKEKMKTVGLDGPVHRELKMLCASRGMTMTEAIKFMMEIVEKYEGVQDANGIDELDDDSEG
jgi:macrodomain Ter protein organizer (MatP/YcbG family)